MSGGFTEDAFCLEELYEYFGQPSHESAAKLAMVRCAPADIALHFGRASASRAAERRTLQGGEGTGEENNALRGEGTGGQPVRQTRNLREKNVPSTTQAAKVHVTTTAEPKNRTTKGIVISLCHMIEAG